jgi:hypothetical protein
MDARKTRVQLSIIENNGREIFQQEREDEGRQRPVTSSRMARRNLLTAS